MADTGKLSVTVSFYLSRLSIRPIAADYTATLRLILEDGCLTNEDPRTSPVPLRDDNFELS